MSNKYTIHNGKLYKKRYLTLLLRCIKEEETSEF